MCVCPCAGTLQGVIDLCKPGKDIAQICDFGNKVIQHQCDAVFKSKKMDKGAAFPTCVSVNDCVCHFAPLQGESQTLAEGDIVKIDLGCHIDGFIAVVAHSLICSDKEPEAVEAGPLADVFVAARTAATAAMKLIKPGNTNVQVTEAIKSVAESYGVNACQGVLMHQMKRFVIDGNKVITQRDEPEQHVEDVTFEANEVYAVDIAMSTGEGKPKERDARTTVFKRAVEQSYRLKMKASRSVFNEVNQRFPTLPFSISNLNLEERTGRMGVVECVKHDLLHPYPVLYEKAGDHVVHVKFTVLLLPSGTSRVTGEEEEKKTPSEEFFKSDKSPTDEIVAILKTSSKKKKKKKKKKAAGAAAGGDAQA